MIVLFKEIVDLKVPRSLALCHSNCLQTRFPFEYTQINITLTHTHPHTPCIIYVKELSVRLSAVSTNDAYEYVRKMGVLAFNLRGMRLCTLTIMGTDVSVPLRIRIIQFNSIQFDTILLRYGSIWFRFRLRFYFSAYQIKTRNQSVVGAKRIPTPFTCIVCVCVSMTAHWRTEVFEKRFRQSHETRGQGRVYVSCHWLYLYLCLCCCCCFYRCHCRQVLSIKIKQKATLCLDHASYSCGYMGVKCAWESSCFLTPQQILNQILRNLRTKSRTISIGPRKV